MKHRTLLRTVLAVLIAAFAVAAWVIHARPAPYDHLQFAVDYPDGRLGVPYWNDKFTQERHAAYNVWLFDDHDALRPQDTAGQYFNFQGGYRVTVGQPTHPASTLWMFGNSTMTGMDVRDADTIPSAMQAIVGSRYRVVNVGVMGATTQQLEIRLEREPIKPGDIVVLLAGGTEPDITDYHKALARFRGFTQKRGAAYYGFLQPIRAFGPDTLYFQNMMRLIYPTWTAQQMIEQYTPLRGAGLIDLSSMFSGARQEMFLDMNHLSPAGNEAVAHAMARALWTTF